MYIHSSLSLQTWQAAGGSGAAPHRCAPLARAGSSRALGWGRLAAVFRAADAVLLGPGSEEGLRMKAAPAAGG